MTYPSLAGGGLDITFVAGRVVRDVQQHVTLLDAIVAHRQQVTLIRGEVAFHLVVKFELGCTSSGLA